VTHEEAAVVLRKVIRSLGASDDREDALDAVNALELRITNLEKTLVSMQFIGYGSPQN
jgi:hypothetical protein